MANPFTNPFAPIAPRFDKGNPIAPQPKASPQSAQTLTVKGYLATSQQKQVADALLSSAPPGCPEAAMVAIIVAGIYESSLGLGTQQGGLRVSPLSPLSAHYTGTLSGAHAQADAFYNGGTDFSGGGAVAQAQTVSDPYQIAVTVEGAGSYTSGPNAQTFPPDKCVAEARAFVSAFGGHKLSAGGVAGQGTSTGTSANDTSPSGFTMGTTSNPDQDFWTTINQLAQERQWYLFSDGETVYLADGPDLLQQTPAMTLDRWRDAGIISHLSFTWDNTAFQYTVNRKKPLKRTVRKSKLQKVQSPVNATLNVICDIDAIRAGDIIYLTGCGPGNGKWLVGDATRSVFSVSTECTLVPPMSPLTEKEAAGAGSNQVSGAAASAPGSGTVIAQLLSTASSISNADIPYIWGGGHATAGVPSIGQPGNGNYDGVTKGFDCSGSVAAVLHGGGLMNGPVPGSGGFPAALGQKLVRGQGSGTPECTLFLNGWHIFMRLNGQYFGTTVGGSDSYRLNGATNGGPTWWKKGSPAPYATDGQFQAWHIPQPILGTVTGAASTGGSGYGTMYDTANASPVTAIQAASSTPYAVAGYIDGSYQTYSALAAGFPAARHLSITVTGNPSANCLDIETGNPVPASGAGAWVKSAIRPGQSRPVVYAQLSNMPAIKQSLAAAGLARSQYRLWVADWTGTPHIPTGYDACQWTNGATYDTSLLVANFFS